MSVARTESGDFILKTLERSDMLLSPFGDIECLTGVNRQVAVDERVSVSLESSLSFIPDEPSKTTNGRVS
jgi:hypothetical protein